MNSSLPVVGFDGKRGRRMDWDDFDVMMRDARVTYERREVSRDGRHERIIRCGYLITDGRSFRAREFYAI